MFFSDEVDLHLATELHLLCGQIHCHPASYMSRKCASYL